MLNDLFGRVPFLGQDPDLPGCGPISHSPWTRFARAGQYDSIHTLVKEGWCWWYRKYAPGDTMLEGLEKEAREARIGLWADPQPVLPWEWRKMR